MQINVTIDNLLKNRKRLFWLFQFFFWFAHWITSLITNPNNQQYLLLHTLAILDFFFISLLLWQIYRKHNWHRTSWIKLILLIIIFSILAAFVFWYATRLNVYIYFLVLFGKHPDIHPSNFSMLISILWFNAYPFLAWSTIYFGYKIREEWNDQKLRAEREKSLAQTAQLEMLRYQLNPHFLFNTLSSLRALLRVNIDKAEEMITQISEFLRYSLLEGKNNEVPLFREIEIVKHYLDIEKVRFSDKLLINYRIEKLAEYYPVPVFLIHPLIENAIKHGMKSSPIPLKISINARVESGNLEIEVYNTGKWIDQQIKNDFENTGTGLKNTRKRLEHAYPDNYTFEIVKENDSVRILIKIRRELEKLNGKKI